MKRDATHDAQLPDWINGGEEPQPTRQPVLRWASDVEPEAVEFLWDPYLPLRKLTLLEGDPGEGKTWVALALAAAITQGRGLLGTDGQPLDLGEPGRVLYMTYEDGLEDTIRPRLDLLGAHPGRVAVLEGVEDPATGDVAPITLRDLDVIAQAVEDTNAVLVVVDPIQSYMATDMNDAAKVRPILDGLSRLARRHSCAVLGIRHWNKAQGAKSAYRGLGSIDFRAAARSVLYVGQNPGDSEQRVLVHGKSSCAAQGPSLAYRLQPPNGLTWVGVSDVTAADLSAAEEGREQRSAAEEAVAFLTAELASGSVPTPRVKQAARQAGVSWRTVERVKAKAGVCSRKTREGWVLELIEQPGAPSDGGLGGLGSEAAEA